MHKRQNFVRQRTPYEDMVLEHIERILDLNSYCKDYFLVSHTNEDAIISLEALASVGDLIKLEASIATIRNVLKTSLWLKNNLITKPYSALRLPFDIDVKTLTLYDLPQGVFQKEIVKYADKFIDKSEYIIKRCKDGLQMVFKDQMTCVAFWRTLDYCLIKGYNIKGKILVKKTPLQYCLTHSQSMIFSHPKPQPQPNKKQKKQQQPQPIKFDESDFPAF